ncbi:EmrB/QacA subfamily drug resistance transporter [Mumia flava]|uniref:EmrB/QacA subfamily drug resistance transporter n=1 Tax=Mumia flava TaxID=1348852 RepID=A0A2M9BJ17_9ACTN|nr:MFS transporter [Mumia flava]PJJ57955.1 EmrB/QacA subfamily drug resistance transporter [Mumia flava]
MEATVALRSPAGRWLLLATVLGSSIAMLDATVVNVALPTIGDDLDADVAALQWVVNGYTLALASLILLGGALGDRFGRRRIFVLGVTWFAVASLLCGIAPTVETLVVARVLQGVGGALLTPGSLALISASLRRDDRGAAIGAWSGLSGVATAIGPLVGGWLVEAVTWRAVFLINLPLAAVVVWVTLRHVPESRDEKAARGFDITGVVLAATGLALLTYGLIDVIGWLSGLGVAVLVAFVLLERRSPHPLVPLGLFRDRVFTSANIVTVSAYAAIGGVFFLLVVQLQVVSGYTPLAAGAATLPITLLMLAFSSYAGAVGTRIGPRIPMTLGPLVAAVGLLLMLRIGPDASYLLDVLPGVVVLGVGLTIMVAPLTTAVLAAAPDHLAGTASGINNAIARTAQMLAVAALPPLVGITGDALAEPAVFSDGFDHAMVICAGLFVVAALTAASLVRTPSRPHEVPVELQPGCDVACPRAYPQDAGESAPR